MNPPTAGRTEKSPMDILYLLIPLSAVLVLLIIGVFGWAVHKGQFDDVEREGERILHSEGSDLDDRQPSSPGSPEESRKRLSDSD
jgi:cbb3-type cytochrome oxidase maturation protein